MIERPLRIGDDGKFRCDVCRTPVAEVQDRSLVIRSRHNGERHVTVLDLEALCRYLSDRDERHAA